MPCLGFGLSAGGFWKGKLIGTSVTSYMTLKCPSETSLRKGKGINSTRKVIQKK
jgi:hypothetical protein